jgi:hypothetical protein
MEKAGGGPLSPPRPFLALEGYPRADSHLLGVLEHAIQEFVHPPARQPLTRARMASGRDYQIEYCITYDDRAIFQLPTITYDSK